MYNYEKNREQVVNDLDRVIKLIHMKADEIPEEEKAQMVKETVEHFNSYVSPGWINYRKCISSEAPTSADCTTTKCSWMLWVVLVFMSPATAKT